jgi:RNA polymerase sigma factor (sigma-70 family)
MTLLPWKRKVREEEAGPPGFEELAMPQVPALYNVAMWLTHNPSDAEDLVQETLFKSLRGFAGFERGTNFKAWIFRILRNTYLTSRTGLTSRRTVALEEELDANGGNSHPESAIDRQTPELNLLRLADHAALTAAMERLAPSLLEVVLLCDVEEMKYKEIATVLDVPIGTVMSRIARARAQLRRFLEEDQHQSKGFGV